MKKGCDYKRREVPKDCLSCAQSFSADDEKGGETMECISVEIAQEIYDTLSEVTDEYWSVAEEARQKALDLIESNKFEVDRPE